MREYVGCGNNLPFIGSELGSGLRIAGANRMGHRNVCKHANTTHWWMYCGGSRNPTRPPVLVTPSRPGLVTGF